MYINIKIDKKEGVSIYTEMDIYCSAWAAVYISISVYIDFESHGDKETKI